MKPYILCYMMTSVDGRIDCAMTAQLKGTDDYYRVLGELDILTVLSGRNTAELEMSLPGKFKAKNYEPYGKEGFSKKTGAPGYEIIADTKGSLLWEEEKSEEQPHLIITGEKVSKEYLNYLDGLNISWIVCGKDRIDLERAVEILAENFGVKRMGIVGGPAINTAFLNAGLLSEVDILIGPGIDGRAEMPSVFEGREDDKPLRLTFEGVKTYDSGAVLLSYKL